VQAVQLLKKANPAVLARLVANRDLRAAAYFPFGCYEAITFTHEIGASNYSTKSASLTSSTCEPPTCIGGIHIDSFLSHDSVLDVVGFAVLDVTPGNLSDVLEQLGAAKEAAPADEVVLFSPIVGGCDLRVIVEVMAAEERAVLGQLLTVADTRGVDHVSTLVTFGELTWGFGDEADPVEGTPLS
jgi:hypothetical protein